MVFILTPPVETVRSGLNRHTKVNIISFITNNLIINMLQPMPKTSSYRQVDAGPIEREANPSSRQTVSRLPSLVLDSLRSLRIAACSKGSGFLAGMTTLNGWLKHLANKARDCRIIREFSPEPPLPRPPPSASRRV